MPNDVLFWCQGGLEMYEHGSLNGYTWHANKFFKLYRELTKNGKAQEKCQEDGASLTKLLTKDEVLKVGEMCLGIRCWTG